MKRLLVAYDGSPCSAVMLDDLGHAGLPAELDVIVVSVADVWLPSDPEKLEPAFPDPVPKAVREARASDLRGEMQPHVSRARVRISQGPVPEMELVGEGFRRLSGLRNNHGSRGAQIRPDCLGLSRAFGNRSIFSWQCRAKGRGRIAPLRAPC